MPAPTKAPHSARSRANLKRAVPRGGNRHTPEDKEVKRLSKKMLLHPTYQKNLRKLLFTGRLHPSVEVMLWYFGFGKPTETIETKTPTSIRIVNEFQSP